MKKKDEVAISAINAGIVRAYGSHVTKFGPGDMIKGFALVEKRVKVPCEYCGGAGTVYRKGRKKQSYSCPFCDLSWPRGFQYADIDGYPKLVEGAVEQAVIESSDGNPNLHHGMPTRVRYRIRVWRNMTRHHYDILEENICYDPRQMRTLKAALISSFDKKCTEEVNRQIAQKLVKRRRLRSA